MRYRFRQNNSGGFWKEVTSSEEQGIFATQTDFIVEAGSKDEALNKLL